MYKLHKPPKKKSSFFFRSFFLEGGGGGVVKGAYLDLSIRSSLLLFFY